MINISQKRSPRNIRFFFKKYIKNDLYFSNYGLNPKKKKLYINNRLILELNNEITKIKERNIKQKNFFNFNDNLKNYKNYRNRLGYPCRGQRTHTNAKTKKKFKK